MVYIKTLIRIFSAIWVLCLICRFAGAAEPDVTTTPAPSPAEKPIATGKGKVADLLRQWYTEGTAAGNIGDWYDNRDRGHSGLKMSPYPQLQKVTYTPEQLQRREDYGLQQVILPHVTFGNSSTAAPPERGGSISRTYYTSTRGLAFLFTQYFRSNIYIYPEHRDHDPGRNGVGGYGDLYPTNTPYLIISQGSSGSDQPFMRAIPYVLAAFRPDVKAKLIKTGMLMPTLQMIMRITNKNISGPEEYLTGKAHPTVFSGRNLDILAMVKTAHEITTDTIPPIALLDVVREDEMVAGRDFFGTGISEKLGDTPVVIARIFHGAAYQRKMVVRVSKKGDVNNRPLTFQWVVLRGDTERIKIKTLKKDGSEAELIIPYHQRRPIVKGSTMASTRVDIGVFAYNGTYYSPPSFITFFSLDNEARTYGADGRILEIGYGAGTPHLTVPNWIKFFDMLKPETTSFPALLLKDMFSKEELRQKNANSIRKKADANLKKAQKMLETFNARRKKGPADKTGADLIHFKTNLEAAEEIAKKADADYKKAKKDSYSAKKAESKVLSKIRPVLKTSVKNFLERALNALTENPYFLIHNTEVIGELYTAASNAGKAAFDKERNRLIAFGVIAGNPGRVVEVTPALKGNGFSSQRLTTYEKKMLRRLNAAALTGLFLPEVIKNSFKRDYVDRRIAGPKVWRDVYHYDKNGGSAGWTRYDGNNIMDFNSDGLIVLERDSLGRCIKARKVLYNWAPLSRNSKGQVTGYSDEPLKFQPGKEIVYYEYDNPKD